MSEQSISNPRIEHLLAQIQSLKYNQSSLKDRNKFLEQQLKKERERSDQLVSELEDMHNLSSRLKCQTDRSINRNEGLIKQIKEGLEEEMKERLKQKDVLIKEIRINNLQSEDFLRKRIESYENQYKLLENNYQQLKQLFDDYQFKSQTQKAKWVEKKKYLESIVAELMKGKKQEKYQNLQQEYFNLLQKSAKSERRISIINSDIEDISRQYSKKLITNIGRRPQDELSMRKNTKSYDKLNCFSKQQLQPSSSRYDSLQTSKLMHPQSTRRSPFRTTNNKQNSSFFSNVNGITNFVAEDIHGKQIQQRQFHDIQVQMIGPPSSDRVETHKKKFLQHLVINSQRQSFKPNSSMLQVQTPCFEDKSRFQKKEMSKVRKINLKSRKI